MSADKFTTVSPAWAERIGRGGWSMVGQVEEKSEIRVVGANEQDEKPTADLSPIYRRNFLLGSRGR